jgi:uncharacterized protein (DUF1501 family)
MAMKNNWTYCNGNGELGSPKNTPSRRQLLAGAATLLASGVWWSASNPALAQAMLSANGYAETTLISIFLRGGADGLNIIAPYADDDYYRHRPSLAIPNPKSSPNERRRLTDLDGFFGINPALLPLLPDFKDGNLAAIHAVGSADQSHSHFQAMETMELGMADPSGRVSGGWLARHLNATSARKAPLRAVAFSPNMPDSFRGASGALAINELAEYHLTRREPEWINNLTALYQRGDSEIAEAGRDTLRVLELLNQQDPRSYRPSGGANYPDSILGRAMRETAFLIKQEVGLEICCLDSVGWDSHVTQGTTDGWLYELLNDVAQSIAAFRTDLGPRMNRIVITVQTEFGRRVAENSGLGTDHGSASTMLVMGANVQGGRVYADWPGLIDHKLSGPGDLKVTTDYRNILAEVTTNHLSSDPHVLFPGLSYQPKGIMTV